MVIDIISCEFWIFDELSVIFFSPEKTEKALCTIPSNRAYRPFLFYSIATMMDSSASAPTTSVEDNTGGEQDPWATLAAAAGEEPSTTTATPSTEPVSVSHAEGETFTMPDTNTNTTSKKDEFLTAVSNLGSVITAKAHEVDQQHHVSEKWGNTVAATKQKTDAINEKYQVSEKWGNLTRTVSVKVEKIKEDPKTKEATENVKKGLVGASSWVSQKFQAMKTGGGNSGGTN